MKNNTITLNTLKYNVKNNTYVVGTYMGHDITLVVQKATGHRKATKCTWEYVINWRIFSGIMAWTNTNKADGFAKAVESLDATKIKEELDREIAKMLNDDTHFVYDGQILPIEYLPAIEDYEAEKTKEANKAAREQAASDAEHLTGKPYKVNKIVRLNMKKKGWWTPGLQGYLPLNRLIPILVEEGAKPIIVCNSTQSIKVHAKMKEIAVQIGKFSYEVNKIKGEQNAN